MKLPPPEYFQLIKDQHSYRTADLSDYGPTRWPDTFPNTWNDHCKMKRVFVKLNKKRSCIER